MNFLGAWLFVLAAIGIGLAVADWLHGRDEDVARCGFGRAFLLGAASIGIALHIPLAIDGEITHRSFAVLAAVGGGAWIWNLRCWLRHGLPDGLLHWIRDLPRVGQLMLTLVLIAGAVHCCRSILTGYDARSIYALKARVIYDVGSVRGEDFCDPSRVNFNPGYPLLLPLLEAQIYWPVGSYEDQGLKFLFLAFALGLAAVCAAEVRRFENARFAALTALGMLLTPMMICCFEGAGLSGSADVPLAAFLLCGVMELSRAIERANWRTAIGAALFFGAAILTKSEGIILVGLCGAAWLATWCAAKPAPERLAFGTRASRGLLLCGAVAAGSAAHRWQPVFGYYPSYFAALEPHWLGQIGDRFWPVLSYCGAELLRFRFWNLIWPCVIGSLVLLRRGRTPDRVLFWRLTALGIAVGYLGVFVTTPLHLQYQMMTSATRLMLHYFPLSVLIMAEQLAASGWSGQLAEAFDPPAEAPSRARSHRIARGEGGVSLQRASRPARPRMPELVNFIMDPRR